MDLVPNGKIRLMVAQNFSNPLSDGFDNTSLEENTQQIPEQMETEKAMEEDIGNEDVKNEKIPDSYNDDISIPKEDPVNQTETGRKTLTTYVYEKLQSYGYPGRRLQEFKSEFVKESISPDGVKDIQVVIPDKKYPDEKGFTDTVENEELKEISHEVSKMFGLNFNGAERSDGKWTIKFTSADLSNPEEEITRDNLDQVYGKPDKGNKAGKKPGNPSKSTFPSKPAFTIQEMIKESKKNFINKRKEYGE